MAAKSTPFSGSLLKLILNGTPIASLAANAATNAATVLHVSLHTDAPLLSGDPSNNEVAYTGYARVAVARDGTGWVVTGNSASPAAQIAFGERTDTGPVITATHMAVGVPNSIWMWSGRLLDSAGQPIDLLIQNGTVPIIRTTTKIMET